MPGVIIIEEGPGGAVNVQADGTWTDAREPVALLLKIAAGMLDQEMGGAQAPGPQIIQAGGPLPKIPQGG